MRALLNELDFTCDDEQDCENNKIRQEAMPFLKKFQEVYIEKIYQGFERGHFKMGFEWLTDRYVIQVNK